MGDHRLLVEEYVPLDGLIELLRKSSVRDGLGSWSFPHAADLACVDYLRQELERGGGRSGVLDQTLISQRRDAIVVCAAGEGFAGLQLHCRCGGATWSDQCQRRSTRVVHRQLGCLLRLPWAWVL